ncbi:hypothetical protein DOK76_08755 [Vagococcus sp. DIV0080]|uniref:Uncharacterized protein n=1 Tax=Candidatus Vagococcus giribetii TaxID=2230876 RepID=A0ABS3HTS2_9ENTE|nr:hypothetical protein [Vagococcus sp. DIV0080]MBO0477160.1 hypothetical protein [Vagococcus sp. DIV0080]
MHFITENELRVKYRKQAFSDFYLQKEERLTPEAKQFLSDKKIRLTSVTDTSDSAQPIGNQFDLLRLACLECGRLANELDYGISHSLFLLAEAIKTGIKTEQRTSIIPYTSQLEVHHVLSTKGKLLIKLEQVIFTISDLEMEKQNQGNELAYLKKQLIEMVNQLIRSGE